jgi:hypothetical protein
MKCLFQANDKARTGYLAAVQARNLLLQTGLAQQTLATVWNLADIDKVTAVRDIRRGSNWVPGSRAGPQPAAADWASSADPRHSLEPRGY